MDVETKPLLHFNIDNIKVEKYYEGFEDIKDPLFHPSETAYNRDIKQEINGEERVINNEFNYDSASDDSGEESSETEFRAYPSKTEDLTIATGMTRIIEKLLRNKELLKNVKLEDEISTVKVEEAVADYGIQFEESSNSLISDSNQYTYMYEKEELHAKSESTLGTLQHSSNSEKTNYSRLHEKRAIGNKLEEISSDNFHSHSFALNKSVTITPLVSKLSNGINKGKDILEKNKNLDINYSQSLPPLPNNKMLASKTISNEKHIFTPNRDNLKQLLNKPCKNYQQEHKQNLESQMMYEGSSQYDLANYHYMMDSNSGGFGMNSTNNISNIAQSWHSPSATVVNQHSFQQEQFFQTMLTCIDNQDINSRYKVRTYLQSKDSLNSAPLVYNPILPPWTTNQIARGCNQMLRSNSNSIIIPCIYCPFKTTDFHNWFFHNRGFHKENMVICPFCGYLQNKKPYMQTHVYSVHLGYKPYSCHICPFSTGWKNYLKIHLLKHNKSQ